MTHPKPNPTSRDKDGNGKPASEGDSSMQFSDVTNLVKLLDKSGLAELRFSDGTFSLVLKKESKQVAVASAPAYYAAPAAPAPAAAPAAAASTATSPAEKAADKAAAAAASGLKDITSPMVGTFYGSATPGAPALAQVGTMVKAGQVVCIIEAMKIMNEIQAEVKGTVTEVLVENGQPVEYGQKLFRLKKA